MKLHQAFDIVRGDVVAFVGAGGKTSALVGLGYELMEMGWRVLATATTYIDEEQLSLMPFALRYKGDVSAVSLALNEHRFVFLYGHIEKGRVYAPSMAWLTQILDNVDSDALLIEADKSDGVAFKAPYSDEPTIPQETTIVVPLVSLSALDKPLDDKTVYNPQAMIEKYGFYLNAPIFAPWIGQVLRDEEFGLKGIPPKARIVAFLNQTGEKGYVRQRARTIARSALRNPRISSVAIGSIRGVDPIYEVQRSVAAIVLAAGMSTRMGQPKMLLPWVDDKPIIVHIVEQLIRSRLDHICVVTGAYADEIKALLKPLDVQVVNNRTYQTGEMLSSVKAGLRSMPQGISASMVVLGDQPRLEPKVLYKVLRAYAESSHSIVIPSFQMKRGHPLVIGKRHWKEILALKGNDSLRDVINANHEKTLHVDVGTESILHDVDTPQDYQQERLRAGLPLYWQPSKPKKDS